MADEQTNVINLEDEPTFVNEISYLDRNTYDGSEKYSNHLYLVKETNDTNNQFVSLYVGESRQADLLDITDYITGIDPDTITPSTIPDEFKIPNKLICIKNTSENTYKAYMYDRSNDVFIQVGGSSGGIVFCDGLPESGSEGILYADSVTRRLYVFNESVYIPYFGYGASVNSDNCTVLGPFDYHGYNQSLDGSPTVLTIPKQTGSSLSSIFELSENGNFKLYGDNTSSKGNIEAATGVKLATPKIIDSVHSGTCGFLNLPDNGTEIVFTNSTGLYKLSISNLTPYARALQEDYNSVIILKKHTDLSDINDLFDNFTEANSTPKIYLLNSDFDVSDKTVIHVMLFWDGFHVCAIVAGYNDAPAP